MNRNYMIFNELYLLIKAYKSAEDIYITNRVSFFIGTHGTVFRSRCNGVAGPGGASVVHRGQKNKRRANNYTSDVIGNSENV